MKKVIGINGSPRKKNSSEMLDFALKGATSKGAEAERIDLGRLNFSGCKSCFACKLKDGKSFGRCAVRDELTPVLEKILAADAVILSTPIYWGDVTGMVRNLVERLLFPGLTYKKDGTVAYDKAVDVGLIFTMGMPDLSQVQHVVEELSGNMQYILRGKLEIVTTHETLQYNDYSKYVGDYKLDVKEKIHQEQYPIDCRHAFEMGARLAE